MLIEPRKNKQTCDYVNLFSPQSDTCLCKKYTCMVNLLLKLTQSTVANKDPKEAYECYSLSLVAYAFFCHDYAKIFSLLMIKNEVILVFTQRGFSKKIIDDKCSCI